MNLYAYEYVYALIYVPIGDNDFLYPLEGGRGKLFLTQ